MKKRVCGFFKKRVGKTIAVFVALMCLLMIITGINKPHLTPFSFGVETLYSNILAYSDRGSVVVDTQNTRMLFLSSDNKVTDVVDMTKSGAPFSNITSAVIYNDNVYVSGVNYYDDGEYILDESILNTI